jgi:hypothetical protein
VQENIRRNFGMPQPNGYRKAMRFMRHANKFGLPIVTFVDTPGAYAGRTAEELGQVRKQQLKGRAVFSSRMQDTVCWPVLVSLGLWQQGGWRHSAAASVGREDGGFFWE